MWWSRRVEAQRGGDLATAGRYFDLAFRLNPASPAALVNRDFNRALAVYAWVSRVTAQQRDSAA